MRTRAHNCRERGAERESTLSLGSPFQRSRFDPSVIAVTALVLNVVTYREAGRSASDTTDCRTG